MTDSEFVGSSFDPVRLFFFVEKFLWVGNKTRSSNNCTVIKNYKDFYQIRLIIHGVVQISASVTFWNRSTVCNARSYCGTTLHSRIKMKCNMKINSILSFPCLISSFHGISKTVVGEKFSGSLTPTDAHTENRETSVASDQFNVHAASFRQHGHTLDTGQEYLRKLEMKFLIRHSPR